jgi:hypothetical protein
MGYTRVCLLEEKHRGLEDGDHVAEVDKVKVVAIEPLIFNVVD